MFTNFADAICMHRKVWKKMCQKVEQLRFFRVRMCRTFSFILIFFYF